jgi:hypothetical protein
MEWWSAGVMSTSQMSVQHRNPAPLERRPTDHPITPTLHYSNNPSSRPPHAAISRICDGILPIWRGLPGVDGWLSFFASGFAATTYACLTGLGGVWH